MIPRPPLLALVLALVTGMPAGSALAQRLADLDARPAGPRSGLRPPENALGYRSGPDSAPPLEIARRFVAAQREALGLTPADLAGAELERVIPNPATGSTRVFFRQFLSGIPVDNGRLQVNVNRDGRITALHNDFVSDLESCLNTTSAEIPARRAASLAAASIGADARQARRPELRILPVEEDTARLVWNFRLATPDRQQRFEFNVDAVTGRIWTRFDQVSDALYRVYAAPTESPHFSDPEAPADGRGVVADVADPIASPLGWHDTGLQSFTVMRGNNVHVFEDRDSDDLPPDEQSDCGPQLECDFPLDLSQSPFENVGASLANLFYWSNRVHDVQYRYGFVEIAGNFQANNFLRGGEEGDALLARSLDTDPTQVCNSGFFTPEDGVPPEMAVFTCPTGSETRDAALDAFVVVHEYGHGISARMLGGPLATTCLSNPQSISEGWSDLLGLVYTAKPGDSGATARGFGTWAFGQGPEGPGVRPLPYTTDFSVNDFVYSDMAVLGIPHDTGSIWAQAGWQVFWNLVDAHGFDPNLHDSRGGAGNQRMLLYLQEGLANTPCRPSFLDARDGILQAAMDNYEGEDECRVWRGFALRGMGENADDRGPSSSTPIDGFDVPTACFDSKGVVALSPVPAMCGFRLDLEVVDVDLAGQGELEVSLESAADVETLVLHEPEPDGRFRGVVFPVEAVGQPANGRFEVSDGDTITLVYLDADDGEGAAATASQSVAVSCNDNLGFERADFHGWERRDLLLPGVPLQVAGSGVDSQIPSAFRSQPSEGDFAALLGFGDNNAGTIVLATDLLLAPATSSLSLDYRGAWLLFGSSAVRTFALEVEAVGGGPAAARSVILEASGATSDTGNVSASVDLSHFAGRPVRLSLEWLAPPGLSGPAFFQLDNLVLHRDQLDADGDGAYDANDNCLALANDSQCDSDRDGFGNLCDPDLDNDAIVGSEDAALLEALLGTTCENSAGACADADLDCDGSVGPADAEILAGFVDSPPGPSGWTCAGATPCPAPLPLPEPAPIAAALSGVSALALLASGRVRRRRE